MDRGYIKLWRKMCDDIILYNEGLCQLAIFLLLNCNHKAGTVYGVELQPGQYLSGRKSLAAKLNQKETTIYKRLKKLQKIGFLELHSSNKNTIVTICKWDTYNGAVTTKGQQKDNKVTTREQQSDTNKNDKIEKNEKEVGYIVDYLNKKTSQNYKPTTAATIKHINARLSDGYALQDFKIVIDKKCAEWIGTEWEKFLRPSTLFSPKFESYLNQNVRPPNKKDNSMQTAMSVYERCKRITEEDENGISNIL